VCKQGGTFCGGAGNEQSNYGDEQEKKRREEQTKGVEKWVVASQKSFLLGIGEGEKLEIT